RQYHPHALETGELGFQVRVAAADLLRQRLVAGRHAFDGIDDASVTKLEPIVRGDGLRPRGESRLVERAVEELARVIPGERPSRAVGPMQARGEPDEDDSWVSGAERGYGTCPIVRIAAMHLGQEFREPRTARAAGVVCLAAGDPQHRPSPPVGAQLLNAGRPCAG